MKKYFCDICGKEITAENGMTSKTLAATLKNKHNETILAVQVVAQNGFSYDSEQNNDSLACKYCVLKAIANLDDSPKPAYLNFSS